MKTKSRIVMISWAMSLLVLFISLFPLPNGRHGSMTAAMFPVDEEDTFEFTNNEAEDAYDLHIHWSRAVKVGQVKPFKKKEGSGTSRTDLSNGVVKRGGKASVTVSWDGSTDAKVEEWWWTKKNGDRLGEEKKGDPTTADASKSSVPNRAASVVTANGLHTITFDTLNGRVRVNLPDDMRAGDTISGTVVAEPKGSTEEERQNNAAKLSEFKLNFGSQLPKDPKDLMILITPRIIVRDEVDPAPSSAGNFTTKLPDTFDYRIGVSAPRTDTETVTITINSPVWFIRDQAPSSPFQLPSMGQQGRPLEIFGPFDGNAANTTLNLDVPLSPRGAFKIAENESPFPVIAESPRKAVFQAPSNFTGPIELNLKEGNVETRGTHRRVAVNLTAPKTNLLKGEKTTLTVQVSGLEGIKEPVPLTLECKGVITMEGGIYQPLMIQPSQVGADGRYTTTRGITGVQTGGWEATATVVTGRFNVWLQDDSDPNRLFHFNSFTGDYIFACGGGSCRGGTGGTSGQPPTGSSAPPPPVTLTGTGRPTMKGCIITLSHNAPDRRVFARLDGCNKTGDATVQTESPKANFNITDKNITDNTAASPTPK